MGSFPAARSIASVKALLSQVPPEQTPSSPEAEGAALEIQLDKPVAQPCPLIPLCPSLALPQCSWPCPARGWLGSAPTPTSWCLAYRAQEGMQSRAPVTGRASYSLIHLHRDQAEIHYSQLCIRPNKVKQPCLTEKPATLHVCTFQLLPSAIPNWNRDQKQPKSHELTWFPRFSGWIIYATVFHQQENTITKCKQRLKTPTIWITVQGAAGEEQECSVVPATSQTLPLPN